MILEIGSGTSKYHRMLIDDDVVHIDIDRSAFHVESLCDAHILPFVDDTFSLVFCSHVLEHCDNPLKVLYEIRRVCKSVVNIKVPNGSFFKSFKEDDSHIYSWNSLTFETLLCRVFPLVRVYSNFHVRYSSGVGLKSYVVNLFKGYVGATKFMFAGDNELIGVCHV